MVRSSVDKTSPATSEAPERLVGLSGSGAELGESGRGTVNQFVEGVSRRDLVPSLQNSLVILTLPRWAAYAVGSILGPLRGFVMFLLPARRL